MQKHYIHLNLTYLHCPSPFATPCHKHPNHSQNSPTWAKACLVFSNCKHEPGTGTKRRRSRSQGNNGLGWHHALQDGKSNLEIFLWPRVKRMILLWDESLDDALHDGKRKKRKSWVRERRYIRHTGNNRVSRQWERSWISLCPLSPQHGAFFLGLTFLIWWISIRRELLSRLLKITQKLMRFSFFFLSFLTTQLSLFATSHYKAFFPHNKVLKQGVSDRLKKSLHLSEVLRWFYIT